MAAGREATQEAVAKLGGRAPSVVIVFATAGHDQQQVLAGVREAAGDALVTGASAEGIIAGGVSDEGSHAVGAMAIASDDLRFTTYSIEHFSGDARACAHDLVGQIRARTRAAKGLLILFPDGLLGNCTELVRTLESELPSGTPIVGATAGDLLTFERTFQYDGDRARSDTVSALFIEGGFDAEIVVTHGCDLVGTERTVTRAEGGFVYRIDDQPAWQFFKGYLDTERDSLEAMHIAHLLLAERLPVSENAFSDDFTVRVPVKLDASVGALYFAAGLVPGTRVQLALRNPEKVCERTVLAARSLRARRPAESPLLVLQFDCAGRGRLLLGDQVTQQLTAPVRREFDDDVAWLGMHSYGEIGPLDGRTYFHNYTAVLCALYPARNA